MRASAAEQSLLGARPDDGAFTEAARIAAGETEPTGDIHADADYRREVAGTLVRRALQTARERIESAA
jgi:carbon-monoxide dehydrogenase medium subunit